MEDCRVIFEFTTKALKGLPERGFPIKFQDKDPNSQLPAYLHLVSAHVCMSIDAIDEAMGQFKQERRDGSGRSQKALKKRYDVGSGFGDYIVQEVWLIGEYYVKHVT